MGIKSIIDDYKRKQVYKSITCNLGRIEETDDAIYCYVDEKKYKRKYIRTSGYAASFMCVPFGVTVGEDQKVFKNIIYVFDNINFDRNLFIDSKPNLVFKNCRFSGNISIWEANSILFDENKSNSKGVDFYVSSLVNKVEFVRDHILSGFPNSISINSKFLKIIDTDFRSDMPVIDVKNLIMDDSCIFGIDLLKIKSENIELLGNCCIYCPVEVRLNTKKCNDFSSFKANEIIYNGYSLSKYGDYSYIARLREERQKLVDTLAAIKKMEEYSQKMEVDEYREKLKGRPLSRKLKK